MLLFIRVCLEKATPRFLALSIVSYEPGPGTSIVYSYLRSPKEYAGVSDRFLSVASYDPGPGISLKDTLLDKSR